MYWYSLQLQVHIYWLKFQLQAYIFYSSVSSTHILFFSFKYTGSEEDASSITSGSGLGAQTSPQNSQNTSQQIAIPQAIFDHLLNEIKESKESSQKLQETLQRVNEDFDSYKVSLAVLEIS